MKFAHLIRFYKINQVFFQYGLDELLPWHLLPWYGRLGRYCFFWIINRHPEKSLALRIRLALEDLGPIYIKFGQMLSTRRDLLPDDIADELSKLQDQVAPFDGAIAREIIEKALKQPLENIFDDFDQVPLASASIAQVHTATLNDSGKAVVIKVIRPGINKVLVNDTELMLTFARLVARFLPEGKRLKPIEVIQEYRKTLFDELDMQRESANTIQLRRNFLGSDSLYIPEIYSDYCRNNILVMERIYGIPVADIKALKAQNTNLKLLAERGVEVFFTQVFRDCFFHADMHPGNVFVSRHDPQNPHYIGIDCGIMGTLSRNDQRYLAENFLAFFNRDYRKVATLHVDSGWVPPETNVEEFEFAIRTVCEPIFEKPLSEISFGHVLLNLFNTARRFNMEVQPQLVLLQKTLLYIEGLGRQLYPQLDLWQTAKPFLEEWMKRQVGPQALLHAIRENAPLWAEKLPELPLMVYDNLQQGRRQQQRHDQMLKQLLIQQQSSHRGNFLLGIGATLLICATLLYPRDAVSWLPLLLAGTGVITWFVGWRQKTRYTD